MLFSRNPLWLLSLVVGCNAITPAPPPMQSPPPLDAQEAKHEIYVLQNDFLRFGNGHVDSVGATSFGGCGTEDGIKVPCTDPDHTYYSYDTNDDHDMHRRGNLEQPFYNFGDDRGGFTEMTYNKKPFMVALKAGPQTGGPFDPQDTNQGVFIDIDAAIPTVDRSGFIITSSVYDATTDHNVHRGYGSLTVTQVLDASVMVPDASITLMRTYTLSSLSASLLSIQVSLTPSADLENVRVWYGVGDDWLGDWDDEYGEGDDSPNKFIGQLGNISADNSSLTVSSVIADAGIFFYSEFPGARAVVGDCCDLSNLIDVDPYSSVKVYMGSDNSYGIYLPIGTLASGGETKAAFYFGAGTLNSLQNAVGGMLAPGECAEWCNVYSEANHGPKSCPPAHTWTSTNNPLPYPAAVVEA